MRDRIDVHKRRERYDVAVRILKTILRLEQIRILPQLVNVVETQRIVLERL